ncbi:MAG: SDR family NAD(P)-dependent oxidoreductase [Proteobacteria bacterium]|nr:SDR family NAD(P)-dependent oxidoreductase [Pseudomonadota bacterium]
MGRFDGQVVWITGGGSGIGLASAVEFARQGARVAVSGRRVDNLDAAVAAIEAVGGEALAVACDVTDEEACNAAVYAVLGAWGRLDVCVANAGYAVTAWFPKMDMAVWRKQIETNLFGLVHTIRAAYDPLIESKGRLVLVSSMAGYMAPPRLSAYAATKYAARAIGESLSLELKSKGVSVTVICPGYVTTEIQQVDNAGVFDADRPTREFPLAWSANKAARSIVKAIHRRKLIAPITGHAVGLILIARFWPGLSRFLLARFA